MISAIVAIARNRAIGKNGKLPWHYPSDLKFFKRTTTGGAIVMGFNTWKSIGRPLPNRLNIVLSRTRTVDPHPDVMLMRTKSEVVRFASETDREVFIIGGAEIYREFADIVDRWIVTAIPVSVDEADAFMDPGFLNGFEQTGSEDIGDGLEVKTYEKMS